MNRIGILLWLLLICASPLVSQIVSIPDSDFLNALIEAGVDTDDDGQISYTEAEAIDSLDIHGQNISDMTGIEAFINLESLTCGFNELTSLDLTGNTALTWLFCGWNELTSLDLTGNTALTWLFCAWNELTSLDVSQNTALTELNCWYNQITSLDVSANTALTGLACENNQLTSLDISNNTELTYLYCYDNLLKSLFVSANTALTGLGCSNNQISSLDVSQNTALTSLGCENNLLSSLDVSTNTALTYLYCDDNLLTSLDVSTNTALERLGCGKNQLSNLDVSNNTALNLLICEANQLTNLNVSKNTALKRLECGENQIASMDLSNNIDLWSNIDDPYYGVSMIKINDMPSLQKVCVPCLEWEGEGCLPDTAEDFQEHIDTTGSPNVFFTTDCSGTGITIYSEKEFSIYPNPTRNCLTIETGITDLYDIEITSLNGRMIYCAEMEGTTHQLDLSSFRKGIYLITINSKDFVITKKVIKL